jgi:hypothetical protein
MNRILLFHTSDIDFLLSNLARIFFIAVLL